MWVLLKALIWDPAAARAAGLALLTFGAAFIATPSGRAWWERALVAAPLSLTVGAASAPSTKTKELQETIAEFEARLKALEPPKPTTS